MSESKKYTHLQFAKENGVCVPDMLYLTDFCLEGDYMAFVDTFLSSCKAPQYIVRSAVVGEDGEKTSYAGYFKSSGPVEVSLVSETIQQVYVENKKRILLKKGLKSVHLIVSPFILSVHGGVSFYPWLYFHKHMLVEYSRTPQDAVSGTAVTQLLFSLDKEMTHVPVQTGLPVLLENQLRTTFIKLRTLFRFPIDVEWAFDGTKLYILQIRPVTVSPTALKTKGLDVYCDPSKFEIDQYGETFGKLSLVSFTLLDQLFQNAQYYRDTIGVRGGLGFLRRLATGTVVTDVLFRRKYFSHNHWYSPFIRGVSSHQIETKLDDDARTFIPPAGMSFEVLQYAFDRLQIAEVIAQTTKKSRVTFAQAREYELTHMIDLNLYSEDSITNIWKRNFMLALQPFRMKVLNEPQYAFTTIQELLENKSGESESRYSSELGESIIGVQTHVQGNDKSELLYGNHVKGEGVYIENPDLWQKALPVDTVIITPYIPQTWIGEIPHVRGIVCLQVSALSHVAITLRENDTPTLRVTSEIFKTILARKAQHVDTAEITII